ncbi:MAG: toll/interleukin-1 receptor domain-containing protein, partial [Acidimicrobiales bacterium]
MSATSIAPLRVVISYRREDTAGHAGHLYSDLVARLGEDNVFMDIDTIKPGSDFTEVISRAIAECDVLIAMIGRNWFGDLDGEGRRRIDNPSDFVRLELKMG